MRTESLIAINRDIRARRALADVGHRIANRIASLWFHKRGQDISALVPELAEEASAGIGLAMAEMGTPLSSLIGQELPKEVRNVGFAHAQRVLRRMSHNVGDSLPAWHADMDLADRDDKPVFAALVDIHLLRDRRASVVAKARRMVASARAFHKVNPSRKRDAALRADLRNIRRATSYMIRHVLGDSSKPFDFALSMRFDPKEKTRLDATRISFENTMHRVLIGGAIR